MAQVSDLPEEKLLQPKKEIKCEPVTKSSSEILTELFGAFNAKPPSISDGVVSDEGSKKRKKVKKKGKHKKKKKKKNKKKGQDGSEASDCESEGEIVKKKLKKSKHKKRKRKRSKSDDRSTPPLPIDRIAPKSDSNDCGGETPKKKIKLSTDSDKSKIENNVNVPSIDEMSDIPIPKMPDISKIKLPEEDKPVEKTASDNSDKSKSGTNKIQIKNLKFSSVFEATVKQAEEEARKKAERFEEGQLTETSNSSSEVKALSEVDSGGDTPKQCDLRDKLNKILANAKDDASTREKRRSAKRKSSDKSSRRSRSKSRTRSHKSRKRSRSRSRKSRSRSASHHKSRHRTRSHSRSRSKHRHDSSRSYRRDRRRSKEKETRIEIDKKRLLEIARKNAINMLQTGTLPTTANLGTQGTQNAITAIKCGGKSVDELTDFCKNLSRQEAIGELSSVSSNSDIENEKNDSVSKTFNNPFQIKDRAPIVLNIKGGTALPTQSFQEKTLEQTKVLRQQFPVSSGSQHRGAETEWRPVSPAPVVTTTTKSSHSTENTTSAAKVVAVVPDKPAYIVQTNGGTTDHLSTMPGMIQATNTPAVPPGPQVFPSTAETSAIDIGSIVSQRLTAIRRLQQNPNDAQAITQMYQANQEMSKWAQSKQEPGQFTGSTGAQILTPKELASGYQAWARRDQLQTAAPVSSGMGMHLLQKMGWKPGEGLGKQKNGALTPLLLEVKLDTRGLVAKEETRNRSNSKRPFAPTVKTLAGKHPVSLLGEYCSKRKLGVPSYTLCFECGPDHRKNFLFKVTVNGIEYQPSVASANKKQAKADAATVCLQKLGLIQ